MMNLTREQQLIVESQKDIVLVNAYAGTGKTSTLVSFCKARKKEKILYLAYNASMSKEAQKKFKELRNVDCMTIHSLAFKLLGQKLTPYKKRIGTESITSFHAYKYFEQTNKPYLYANMLIALLRGFVSSEYTMESFIRQVDENERDIVSFLSIFWEEILTNPELPFEHDFYLKIFQLSRPELVEYDYILIDEAQDLNPTMFDIIRAQKCKKVFIGDSFQKIYGFRNCINALEILKDNRFAETFFLTKTFRCPSYIVEKANPYLYLLGAEKPLEGIAAPIPDKNSLLKKGKKECIICRTNARVFDYVIANGDLKFHFVGGLEGYNFNDILDIALLHTKNKAYHKYIKNKFYRNFADHKELRKHIQESDDVEAKTKLMIFYKYVKTINLFKAVKSIKHYPLAEADYIITSAHKSKGLEWDYVKIEDDFLDLKEIVEDAQSKGLTPLSIPREELNLLYVAITRAKKYLDIAESYVFSLKEISQIKNSIVLRD